MGALDRFYLDTNIIVSAIERPSSFGPSHMRFIGDVDTGDIEAVTSELTLAECLIKPLRDRAGSTVAAYLSFLSGRPTFPVVPVDRIVLLETAKVRASLDVKLPDAIHIATALIAQCSIFVTNDKRLKLPAALRKAVWEDVEFWRTPP